MLQIFRDNTQSIVVKIIVGFIIITFALFGVDSLIGLAGQPNAPITVNGVDISERQIAEAIDLQRRQLVSQMGENVDPSLLDDALLRGAAIQNLIERELLRQTADEQGLRISEQAIDATIVATSEFQLDGRFDRNRFESMLRNVGMTPLMYRDYLRNETILAQERSALIGTAFMLPRELDLITSLDRQIRSFKFMEVSVQDVIAGIKVTDEEIQRHYDNGQSAYQSEELISLSYVELNKQDIAATIEIDEAELTSQYELLVNDFEGTEARDASHILITVSDERNEEDALALATKVYSEITAGGNLAELAKKYSDDIGSAEEGGQLGLIEKGEMVPEFEEALFALSQGQISEPIQTDFGYHIIQLNRIDLAEAPTMASVRGRLINELRLQKAESRFVAQSEELDDLRFSSLDLQEASEILGLKIKTTELFGREGGTSAFSKMPKILVAAFSDDVLSKGENSGLIELNANRIVVVHLNEHKPKRRLELSEVKNQISADLKKQKATKVALDKANSELKLAKDQGLARVANGWKSFENIGRGDTGLDAQIVSALFKMAKPDAGALTYRVLTLSDGSVAVIALEKVDVTEAELEQNERDGLSAFLASRLGQTDYLDQVESLKAGADINRL